MPYRQQFGKNGEDEAAAFLEKQGFTIADRNVHCGRNGEIDIVALKDSLVIFAEVKTRSTSSYGGALYAITAKKRLSMRRNAEIYAVRKGLYDRTMTFRFDLIAVENGEINWLQDILR